MKNPLLKVLFSAVCLFPFSPVHAQQLNVSQEDKETVKFFKPNISRVFNLKSRKIEYYNEKEVFKYEEMW